MEKLKGKLLNSKRAYKKLEKYINKMDEPENKNELQNAAVPEDL